MAAAQVDLEALIDEAVAAGKGWTDEERRAYVDNIPENLPLFAESLEEMDPAFVEAMTALAYEGETPASLAANFKDQGNKQFARGKHNKMYYRHAAQFYSKGIQHAEEAAEAAEAVDSSVAATAGKDSDGASKDNKGEGEDKPSADKVRILRATLYANRAAAHLALGNYGSARADCDASLRLVPGNVKCLYRIAMALIQLRRPVEAAAVCDKGLAIDPTNKELAEVRRQCDAADAAAVVRETARVVRVRRQYAKIAKVWEHCVATGIHLGPSVFEESHHTRASSFLPAPDHNDEEDGNDNGGNGGDGGDGGNMWRWPLLLLYPQHSTSDFVEAAGEDDLLAAHLAEIFPEEGPLAPWDVDAEYRCSLLEVYVRLRAVPPFPALAACIADFERRKALRGEEGGPAIAAAPGGRAKKGGGGGFGGGGGGGEEETYAHVHPGCTLRRMLTCDGVVVANALPSLLVFPRGGAAHAHFLRQHAGRIIQLVP
ncbi:unnamed protein product [Phaeothamnion confervicola]